MYKKLLTVILSIFIFASLTLPAFAAKEKLRGNDCLYNDSVVTLDCVPVLFANAVYWLIIMSGVIAVFFIAYGGIKYLTSSGEAKAVDSSRKVITWAIIGLVVIISSFMIVNIIADLTGVTCITKFGFTACGLPSGGSEDSRLSCSSEGGSCVQPGRCSAGNVNISSFGKCSQSTGGEPWDCCACPEPPRSCPLGRVASCDSETHAWICD